MKIKEKAKEFWEENKCSICIAAGGAIAITAMAITAKIIADPGAIVFTKLKNPEFPLEMSIEEIKEQLSKVEGVKFYDSLVAVRNGVSSLFIR